MNHGGQSCVLQYLDCIWAVGGPRWWPQGGRIGRGSGLSSLPGYRGIYVLQHRFGLVVKRGVQPKGFPYGKE